MFGGKVKKKKLLNNKQKSDQKSGQKNKQTKKQNITTDLVFPATGVKLKNKSYAPSDLVTNRHGSFENLEDFRRQTGLTVADVSDGDAWKIMYEDMEEQKKMTEKLKNETEQKRTVAEQEKNRLSQQLVNTYGVQLARDDAIRQRNIAENRLEQEKHKNKVFDSVLSPYRFENPVEAANRIIERERIKKELMEQLRSKRYTAKKSKSKPRARSKPRSKSRSKSRSKYRSKSRSKSKHKTKK